MDNARFFEVARGGLGSLSSEAVKGCEFIIYEAGSRDFSLNELSYILATTWWESGKTMQPVREAFYISNDFDKAEKWRRKHLHYYPYYGRGYVQLTWKANYKKAAEKLGINFVVNPDKVMEPQHAVEILFIGMREGGSRARLWTITSTTSTRATMRISPNTKRRGG